MKNKVFYKYVYSCQGVACTRKSIKFDKTKELGFFHFEEDYVYESNNLLSDRQIECDCFFEKTILEDYLVNKFGKNLKYQYFAEVKILRCNSDYENGFEDVILTRDFSS